MVGRMRYRNPLYKERFYLCMLLMVVPAQSSYEDLHTVYR